MEKDYLLISGIQHYSFCKRQWALIHVEGLWAENLLTAQGHIMHESVHDPDSSRSRNGILCLHGLQVRSERLGIEGTCDLVEFSPSSTGVVLPGRKGKWRAFPVEYKHGESKVSDCDRLQLVAQAICLEEMLCCSIPSGALYYGKTRRREIIEFSDEIRNDLVTVVSEMHELIHKMYVPQVKPGRACRSCSLFDFCLPRLMKKNETVDDYMMRLLNEEDL